MKYICTQREDGTEEVFTFPNSVNHDVIAEEVTMMKNQTDDNWKRIYRKPISAGFVSRAGVCFGRSETLNLDSREKDSIVLLGQF